MSRPLTLAYSPCPNDTFIFAALTNGLLNGDQPQVRVHLEDIASLNNSALKGSYEMTKVSYGAIPEVLDRYRILRAGGALGRGCGPLVVARPGTVKSLEGLKSRLVAIPGERTTAFMLLRLAMQTRPQTLLLRFDKIVQAVAEGVVDAGLIIHESRFTYQDAGLECVADLGEWWESQTGLPIPLGAALVRDDIASAQSDSLNAAIRKSLEYAREHPGEVMPYVREHATEMSEEVMRAHIALYVNDFTNDVGEQGASAVEELFRRAHAAKIIPQAARPAFV